MLIISTGIPIAWGVMDREDIPTLEVFFKSIQGKVPLATVNTLMTDDGMHWHYYNYMYMCVLVLLPQTQLYLQHLNLFILTPLIYSADGI